MHAMESESLFSFIKNLFLNDFMPHGHCYFWRPDIVWLHVISDGFIALSYYAIPFILLFFMRKRKDFPFPWVLAMFGAFILLCGTTHLMAIVTLWDPIYRLDGIIKAATAIVSVITTIMLIPLIPLALALKSPKELEAANKKLALANEKLREIDQLKDNFFSNISHELRTPLTLILAPLESFLANDYGSLSEVQRKSLEAMHNNSIRLFQMVNSILDFAKISSKKIEVKREPLDIVLLTKSITQEFEAVAKHKQIQIIFNCRVTNRVVSIDRYLYERILFNLLSNAVKFTSDKGSITISLNFNEEKAIITIRDTGIGISSSDQKKLFHRFQQIEGSSTRRFEGTGLGLALVKEFSIFLGGDVHVESEVGKGSLFTVEISAPLTETSTADDVKPLGGRFQKYEIVPTKAMGPAKASLTEKESAKILIAEDNLELATYITSLLNDFSETKHVQDGEAALECVKTWEPNLVISDVMMPKKDGISLCREIKSSPKTSHIPVILLTALTHRDALIRGWEAGADEYLFKPFHPKELITRIKLLLTHAHNNILIQELNRKLIISARLAGMSEVATSILHNVGNILNSVNVTTHLLLEKVSNSEIKNLIKWLQGTLADPASFMQDKQKQADIILYLNKLNDMLLHEQKDLNDDIANINNHIKQMNEIIALQQKVEGPYGVVETVSLPELLDEVLTENVEKDDNIHVIKNYNNVSKAVIDKMKLQQILTNLILNAKEALQECVKAQKQLIITAQTRVEGGKEWLVIEVNDNGIGIFPEQLNQIFSFGYTTNPEKHSGFGLHISALSAEKMGGKLSAKSSGKNSGATFSLKLPTEPLNAKKWVKM